MFILLFLCYMDLSNLYREKGVTAHYGGSGQYSLE